MNHYNHYWLLLDPRNIENYKSWLNKQPPRISQCGTPIDESFYDLPTNLRRQIKDDRTDKYRVRNV